MAVKAVDPRIVTYWWKQETTWPMEGDANWDHIVVSVDGPFEAKRYVNGVLQAAGRVSDLQVYEGKKLIEWWPLDGLAGDERGTSS